MVQMLCPALSLPVFWQTISSPLHRCAKFLAHIAFFTASQCAKFSGFYPMYLNLVLLIPTECYQRDPAKI